MTNTHPATDRRARPRTGTHTVPTYRACAANACRQGHKACPTPQACEVADEPPATRAELTGFVLWVMVIAVVIGFAVISGHSA